MIHRPLRQSLPLLAALGAAPVLAGDASDEAGKAMQHAADETGAAIEQAAEKTGDMAKRAAAATGQAAEKGKKELASTSATAGQAVQDAWIDGKLEGIYALNRQLEALDIDTEVKRGVVMLSGTVANRVERDLAGELARGVEGVQDVVNELDIKPDAPRDDEPGFAQWVADATTTAVVKSKLLANEHTSGLAIEVDTLADVVILSGRVDSTAERELAGEIAANTEDVAEVRNDLEVASM
ncbi:MAG: BON domain-containing protein [Gammaproteobacteria bacterium]